MIGDERTKKGGIWAGGVWTVALFAVALMFVAYLLIWNLPSGSFVRMEVSTLNSLDVPAGATEDCGSGQGRDVPVDDYFCCRCSGSGTVELHFDEPLGAGFTVCSACEAACLEEFGNPVAVGSSFGGGC